MSVREQIETALNRDDVQRFLNRRPGVCDICNELVDLGDDGTTLHVLSWAVFPRDGLSLDIFGARSHHLAERRRGPDIVCRGFVPFRQQWINPKSEQYDPDFTAYVKLVAEVGIVNRNGRWVLGDT